MQTFDISSCTIKGNSQSVTRATAVIIIYILRLLRKKQCIKVFMFSFPFADASITMLHRDNNSTRLAAHPPRSSLSRGVSQQAVSRQVSV